MIRVPNPQPARIHLLTCDCADCTRPAPSDPPRSSPAAIGAALLVAGIVSGQVLTVILDAVLAGPGPFAVFGL